VDFQRAKVGQFQEQDCKLTLGEAVKEFYTLNSHLFSRPKPDTEWTDLLVFHDVGHVFFGVNTNLMDEAAGDCWTLFGTDMTFKDYIKYAKTPEGRKLFKEIGFKLIIKSTLYSIPNIYRIYVRSKKMKEKWKLHEYEKFLDVPLGELRRSYNLKILEY